MENLEKPYLEVLENIKEDGVEKKSRAGDTLSLFAQQMRFDLTEGFPAVTTKKLAFNSVASELLWFIEGGKDTDFRMNNERLKEINRSEKTIWTDNAEADYWKPKARSEGDLGRIYGAQWRDWRSENGESVDQLANVVDTLKTNPNDRRMILSAWNPGELNDMALPPCHTLSQVWHHEGDISLHMYQRSCDMFLGVPFNIASYGLLTEMLAQSTGTKAKELVITLGDAHIYKDHMEQVEEQLSRKPYPSPTLKLNPEVENIDDFTLDDISLENYQHHPPIKAKMAV